MENTRYAGFWVRFGATMIDNLIILLLVYPALYYIYGDQVLYESKIIYGPLDVLISYVLPIALTIFLWIKFKGTPGKKLMGIEIVDFETHSPLNLKQSLIRQVGYLVMFLPLGLGFILLAFDKNKRGWHDKMCSSAVIYKSREQ